MPSLLASLPLVLVGLTVAMIAVLVTRALRDERVLDSVRLDVRRLGEAHRAVRESRAVHRGVARPSDGVRRLRG